MPIPYRGPWRRWAEARVIDFLRLGLVVEAVTVVVLLGFGAMGVWDLVKDLRW